jgi:hypothetical protein
LRFSASLALRLSAWAQPAEPGDNLTQEFESLAGKIGLLVRQSSGVAARSRQTCDQAAANRIVRQYKDDRDDRRSPLYCWGGVSIGDNDVDLKADKLGRDFGDALGPPGCPAQSGPSFCVVRDERGRAIKKSPGGSNRGQSMPCNTVCKPTGSVPNRNKP